MEKDEIEQAVDKPLRRNKSSVPSVEKAFDVIELLADQPNGLTMNEIIDRLDRTMGEVYRIVIYLCERGYLEQDVGTNRYGLTLRLFELSHRYEPTERLLVRAVPMLERIAALTDQSCHLGILNRTNVLILASVKSPRPAGYSVRTGSMFPVQQTSTGSIILAFSEEPVQKRFLARLQAPDREEAATRFAQIASRGYEDRPSQMVDGIRNLSAPVFDSRGIVAAITSGYIAQPNQLVSAEEALSKIRTTALELSRDLGFDVERSPYREALSSEPASNI
ncbi:IclR family transcriptional regulator [Shinella sp. 838]|uniref:IclR family transcriptional regulator n=1 Tax=Shinella sp. 838 TaxID=3038164 RepID=UPI002415194C|nr:IclR family transcriptional regulator [Shinella sp. 838]MDG4674928.1 IclR family transcriptional regulator [Shinella sp. 838]